METTQATDLYQHIRRMQDNLVNHLDIAGLIIKSKDTSQMSTTLRVAQNISQAIEDLHAMQQIAFSHIMDNLTSGNASPEDIKRVKQSIEIL